MRLIDADALLDGFDVRKVTEYDESGCGIDYKAVPVKAIEAAPTIDAVSPGVLEQYKWERDTAIAQLEELGIGFGQKKPDIVEVVRCKDCKHHYDSVYGFIICELLSRHTRVDGYCHNGAKMDGAENEQEKTN